MWFKEEVVGRITAAVSIVLRVLLHQPGDRVHSCHMRWICLLIVNVLMLLLKLAVSH